MAVINAQVVGFVEYHHRRDQQTTLYHIAVEESHRAKGVGRALLDALQEEARQMNKTCVFLKCPEGLPANGFYSGCGFCHVGESQSSRRRLVSWRLAIDSE